MILWIGKYILVPVILTWTAWVPFLARHYPTQASISIAEFLAHHKNLSLFLTALSAPYVCLIYDMYRNTGRRIQLIMGTLFVLLTLFFNVFLAFVLTKMLPGLSEDWQIVNRIIEKIRSF